MTGQDWDRLTELFHGSRELDPPSRDSWLREQCGEDDSLRQAVEQMLREDENAGSFLNAPLAGLDCNASPAITANQDFGRYRTIAFLGRGGMGEVWRAWDRDLDRPVALKFLVSGLGLEQLTREARLASSLNHPGIVTVHEVLAIAGTPILVMELVDGAPLPALRRGPGALRELLAVAIPIADALAAAHAKGIVHGDIKPDNLLVRADGFVKILDFGLARNVTAGSTATGGMLAGTFLYMSPEQARAEALGPATDVFSLGVVLAELATGQHPFGRSALPALQAIRDGVAPDLSRQPGLPAALEKLLREMLEPAAAKRPTMASVAARLRALQQPAGASRPWKVAAAVACLLLLGVGGVALQRYLRQRSQPTWEQITWVGPDARLTAAAIAPSGSVTAFANAEGIFLRSGSASIRALAAPPDLAADRLSWLPDESALIASGLHTRTNRYGIWRIPADGGPAIPLREQARGALASPAGRQIAFLNVDGSEVWVMAADGGAGRRLLAASTGQQIVSLVWLPGNLLGVQERRLRPAAAGVDPEEAAEHALLAIDPATARQAGRTKVWMREAMATGDGRLIFLRPYFDRNRYIQQDQVWEAAVEPTTGAVRLPGRMVADLANPVVSSEHVRGLSVTAGGREMVLLRYNDAVSVYTAEFSRRPYRVGPARRLTFDARSSYPHAWTIDGQSIVFESNRNGNYDIYRLALDERAPRVLVASPVWEFMPQATPDGKWVLYHRRLGDRAQGNVRYRLGRVSVDGGEAGEVDIGGDLDEFRCGSPPRGRCVLRARVNGGQYAFYHLDPLSGKGKELARTEATPPVLGDWTVSPDGRQVAIPIHSPREARIRVVSLDGPPGERELPIPGLTDLLGLHWDTRSDGWFTTVTTSLGPRLLFVEPDGRFHPLGGMRGWALPSPDGKRVVFTDSNVAANAILVKRP